jgi:hypothetical protein
MDQDNPNNTPGGGVGSTTGADYGTGSGGTGAGSTGTTGTGGSSMGGGFASGSGAGTTGSGLGDTGSGSLGGSGLGDTGSGGLGGSGLGDTGSGGMGSGGTLGGGGYGGYGGTGSGSGGSGMDAPSLGSGTGSEAGGGTETCAHCGQTIGGQKGFEQFLSRLGISGDMLGNIKNIDIDEYMNTARDFLKTGSTKATSYAKDNPGKVAAGVATLALGAGLLYAALNRDKEPDIVIIRDESDKVPTTYSNDPSYPNNPNNPTNTGL